MRIQLFVDVCEHACQHSVCILNEHVYFPCLTFIGSQLTISENRNNWITRKFPGILYTVHPTCSFTACIMRALILLFYYYYTL